MSSHVDINHIIFTIYFHCIMVTIRMIPITFAIYNAGSKGDTSKSYLGAVADTRSTYD